MNEDRVAVVTGANRGIGKAVARQLHDHGWSVVIGSRNFARGEAVAEELGGTDGPAVAAQLDVADPRSVEQAVSQIGRRFGRVDALINNAAIMYDTWAHGVDVDLNEVRTAMETNLFGAWRTAQAFLPMLRRSRHGRIVNVSSEGGSISEMSGGTPAYSVSKAALNALTRVFAGELRGDRILVNAVCPGWTATDMGGGGRPVEDGAASVTWAVLLPDDGPTGGFFRDGKPLPW
jgi:NAD(P)-dependent dehydrogenase (short-subunit alcohol dehydrogenase family)